LDLKVKVIPRSPRSEVAGVMADGTVKVRVRAAPEGGKANRELCDLLAGHFGVPKSKVEIVSGAASTRKLVRISR
jgi:uncharacterized protein (TIGR00251 family)